MQTQMHVSVWGQAYLELLYLTCVPQFAVSSSRVPFLVDYCRDILVFHTAVGNMVSWCGRIPIWNRATPETWTLLRPHLALSLNHTHTFLLAAGRCLVQHSPGSRCATPVQVTQLLECCHIWEMPFGVWVRHSLQWEWIFLQCTFKWEKGGRLW